MTRRIAAMLLILALLLSVIPVNVIAEDDYIYQIGDDIWIESDSPENPPNEPTVEDGIWKPVIGVNGYIETKPADCGMEIHKHNPSCFDSVKGQICGKVEHTSFDHAIDCGWLFPQYHWVVERDPDYVPPAPPSGGGDSGEGGGLDTDGTGANVPLGDINIDIINQDPDGNPIVGSQFTIVKEDNGSLVILEDQTNKQALEQQMQQKALEQQAKIKELQEAGDNEALEAYLQQANLENEQLVNALNESGNNLLSKTTDENGIAHFHAFENYLEEDRKVQEDGKDTWYYSLFQDKVDRRYKADDRKRSLKIQKTGADTYDVTIDEQPYSEENGFVFTNEIENIRVLVRVEFYDTEGKTIAGDILNNTTVSINLVDENGGKIPAELPDLEAADQKKWQKRIPLAPGTYTAEDPQIGTIDGYTFDHCAWKFEASGASEDNIGEKWVKLGDLTGAALVVQAHYKKNADVTEPPVETPKPVKYTIDVISVDDAGNEITGTEFSLDNVTGIDKKGNSYVINTESCLPGSYILEETVTPAGYERCNDQYTIEVKKNGDVKLSKGNFLQRLFNKTNLAESGGTESVTFVHNRKTALINVTTNVYTTGNRLHWGYQEAAVLNGKTYSFTLKQKDAQGVWQEKEKLSLGNNETKSFNTRLPFGTEYKVELEEGKWTSCIPVERIWTGVVRAADTESKISLSAEIWYEVVAGADDLDLYFTKVDSRTKEKLSGAKFVLKDAYGQELERYTTKKGGAIDIEDIIDQPGQYFLKEIKAPEDYDVLRKPIEINVAVAYRLTSKNGKQVVEQYLIEDAEKINEHKSVSYNEKDGTYWIKNTASGDNPKTGDSFDLQLWSGVLMISMIGLAGMALEVQKKKTIKK